MARRSAFSRPVMVSLMALALVAVVILTIKLATGTPDDAQASDQPQPATQPTVPEGATPQAATPQDTAPRPVTTSLTQLAAARVESPATRPAEPVRPAPAQISSSAVQQLIESADAKRKSDDLLGARTLLVDALDSGKLSDVERDDVLRRLSEINDTVVFSPRKFVSDPSAAGHLVKPGDSMEKIARNYDVPWQFIGRINGISDPRRLQAGKTLKVIKGPFHAVVDKSEFTLDVFLGQPDQPGAIFLKRFRVGLGEHDSTPTGGWLVDTKIENPRYYNPRAEGPRIIEPDDPKNPLGERWIALVGQSGQAVGKTSYGIHGTIEPESIGQRKSMGCIRMLNEDVELLYDMLTPGKSTVTVVD